VASPTKISQLAAGWAVDHSTYEQRLFYSQTLPDLLCLTHAISNPVDKGGFFQAQSGHEHENLAMHLHLVLKLRVNGTVVTYNSPYVVWQLFVYRHEQVPTSANTGHALS
jgi:hypothetical protein